MIDYGQKDLGTFDLFLFVLRGTENRECRDFVGF